MSNFNQLHPALQYHIVNSLGWHDLRPFQEAVIPQLLAGHHLIIVAPTAGGKTEAAFFPILSRMLAESWSGLSVLYLCPIKALLNNLNLRVQRYCTLAGRRAALWHGDVKQPVRRKILHEPPDCLLTTPESLEVMLISPNVDARSLFGTLRVVIVDEIHAFAGDHRGWHLLSVLSRISRLAGRELQRIGLSATVGNPEVLSEWLAGSCQGERSVFFPLERQDSQADVTLDYVGSLQNAAIVISRLYRGEKRLVFIDSRSRAEQLTAELHQLQVTTFITHSSLSQEQRRQAEEAFASRPDCVIVATSVLELGIDVGDLDRVIQIDAPPTVAGFLQRMGRTGRRAGTTRNCLFLATREESLVQAAGVLDLWTSGYVEPLSPPSDPYHILAQQLMALALQEHGIGQREWFNWIDSVPAFAAIPSERIADTVTWMLKKGILWNDQGLLWLGRKGEEDYGRRNFLDLCSVFTSPPLFAVLYGRRELGFVDELTFLSKHDGLLTLLLGGRPWRVTHIDWQRRVAHVEASKEKGRSRWKGKGQALSFRLCQAIRHVLAIDDEYEYWSNRTRQQMPSVRSEFAWLEPDGTALVRGDDETMEWWTFAGLAANATLGNELAQVMKSRTKFDSFSITFEPQVSANAIEQALHVLKTRNVSTMRPAAEEKAIEGLKFSQCLPYDLALRALEARLRDPSAVAYILQQPRRVVVN
ncbi:MAG: DEAD/DEAH box helicase [Candidatus Binatia bacterium]